MIEFAVRAEESEPEQRQIARFGHQAGQFGLKRVAELVGEIARRMEALRPRVAEPLERGFDLARRMGNDGAGHVIEEVAVSALRPDTIENDNRAIHRCLTSTSLK